MQQQEYLDKFEQKLLENLITFCTSKGWLDGKMQETPDITQKWDSISPSYIKDALKEVQKYESVTLAWSVYIGMAIAKYWDTEWDIYSKHENLYLHLRDKRGFDYLDEVVRGQILCLDKEDFTKCEDMVRECVFFVMSAIRKEQVERGSVTAFYVYTRSLYVLYRIGAAIELKKLGYKMEKMQ